MAKVHLDFGHGGKDPGALGNNLKEKDINLSVGLLVGEILEKHKVVVTYSRKTDVFVNLTPRTTMANNANVDIFVSIHCNAFSNPQAIGLETLYNKGSVKGKQLAQSIQDSLLSDKLYNIDRGLKERDDVTVLIKTKMPAALVELAFITNTKDALILKNKQKKLAESVAKGILKYLGIAFKVNAPAEPKDKVKIKYKNVVRYLDGTFVDDKNYVSVRELAEMLGFIVDWEQNTKTVVIK